MCSNEHIVNLLRRNVFIGIYTHTPTCVCVCVYIYIYIYIFEFNKRVISNTHKTSLLIQSQRKYQQIPKHRVHAGHFSDISAIKFVIDIKM